MATLNERDQLRNNRDQLRENHIVADDMGRSGLFGYGLLPILTVALGLALVAWFAFGTATTTVNNSPSITAPVTTSPTPTAIPERQPPTNP